MSMSVTDIFVGLGKFEGINLEYDVSTACGNLCSNCSFLMHFSGTSMTKFL